MQHLTAYPDKAVTILGEQLKYVPVADPKRIQQLVAELDADEFLVRRAAAKALAEFDSLAIEEPLRKVLAGKPSDEARKPSFPAGAVTGWPNVVAAPTLPGSRRWSPNGSSPWWARYPNEEENADKCRARCYS
jgi:hypothetical protein